MKELDELYDWLLDLKEYRVSYGKSGIKQIHQSDMDKGMTLYLKLKQKILSREKAIVAFLDLIKKLKELYNE
jgi:hypothetical protein